ncbi:MAG TPA: tRNA pseudouridine(55) synthase TruB, partial [Dehalococcoidales bacterium]|nr:tRNA pseudouridine(55) synthase TruB [Dehalococcoidales bacterium]
KTSFSIVSLVRRLSGEKRVGHAGTLDPAATGVLPVCLGQGTRIIQFLLEAPKAYRAEIELGVATDTHDATGTVVSRGDPSGVSREKLLSALESFRGPIEQTPPMYSAVKHEGKPLYELARAGIEVARKSRLRWVYRLELLDWQPPVATIEVECSKGTYIRSLADDLGQLLGCGANLKNLARLKCGLFTIEDAITVPQLEDGFRHGYWQQFLYPIDIVLSRWGAVVVDDAAAEDIKNGRPLALEAADNPPPSVQGNRCRVYTRDGTFLAMLCFDSEKGLWQPEKVFATDR